MSDTGETPSVEEGKVQAPDGVALRYRRCRPARPAHPVSQAAEGGRAPLVVANAIYLEDDLAGLAEGREVVFYDLRGRGLSDAVTDPARLGIERDVEDLETVRSALGLDRMDLLGHSYLGLMVVLYALEHPERLGRIVQIGPAGPANEFLDRTPRPGSDPEALDLAAWQALLADRATPVRDPKTYSRRF
jgi:pimeloyl-ACP methyl ester carboxylesterase